MVYDRSGRERRTPTDTLPARTAVLQRCTVMPRDTAVSTTHSLATHVSEIRALPATYDAQVDDEHDHHDDVPSKTGHSATLGHRKAY